MNNTIDLSRWHGVPQARPFRFGELTATYIRDGAAQIRPSLLLPDSPRSYWDSHPHLLDADGYLVIGAGGLLVQATDWAILIDTGFGPLEVTPALAGLGRVTHGDLLTSLAEQGVQPADLAATAVTHLHPDHVGWWANGTDVSGRGPFADLPAYIGKAGWAHGRSAADPALAPAVDALADAIRPVSAGTTIAPGVTVLQTPGHTSEHTAYVIESGGETLIAFGDAFHSVAQFAHPEWTDSMDHDDAIAAQTRRELLRMLLQPNTYGFGVHFADVTIGRVVEGVAGYAWQPVDR